MTINTTLAEFRTDIACDIYQLPDTTALRYYNDSRDELIDEIIKEKEDYFYNYFTWATLVWQNEYTLAKRWDLVNWTWPATLPWIYKIKWVSVKFKSTDTELTVLRPITMENLERDIEAYDETTTPFYCLMDNSIFVYPAPTEVNEYRIYAITYPKKVIWTDEETLPDQHIKAILYWVKARYLESQTRLQEAQLAQAQFDKEKTKVAKALSGRIQTPIQRTTPNLNFLT